MLPDFRVRQRDYLLEISRALTQELDQEKLLARILLIAVEMLAGQAGIIALKERDGWRVAAAHGIARGRIAPGAGRRIDIVAASPKKSGHAKQNAARETHKNLNEAQS